MLKRFLKCYVDNMPIEVQQSLAGKIGKSVDPTSREFFDSLKEHFTTEDCIGTKVQFYCVLCEFN